MSKQNPEDLAQKAFELRINKANAEISKVLKEHRLAITAELVYTPQGIFPKPSLINAPKNAENKENSENQPEQG